MKHILIVIFFITSSGICFGADQSRFNLNLVGQIDRAHHLEEVPDEWKACSIDHDCEAIHVACWGWEIANRKHHKDVRDNIGPQKCLGSSPDGTKPEVACINHVCVNKEAKGVNPNK